MKLYFVSSEGAGILNPGERGFRSLAKAEALAVKAVEECSRECLTPPGADNDRGNGRFLCGTLSPHGIHIRASEGGFWGEEFDVPEEKFGHVKVTKHADWCLQFTIDRGTGYLADGDDAEFYSGPERTDTGWDEILNRIAEGDEIIEATVTPLQHGRYWHLIDEDSDYPMVWRQGHGF